MRLSKWMDYNEFFPAYSSLFDNFWGPDLFIEEKKETENPENSIPKVNSTPPKKEPLTPIQRRELARILAKEIIFDI